MKTRYPTRLQKRANFTTCLLAGVLSASLAGQSAPAQQPLVELRFNETTSSVVSTGIEKVEGKMVDAEGETQNLHSQDRSGVSGKIGDRAFDNSSATMGGAGGMVVLPAPPNIPLTAKAFTITGWFKQSGSHGPSPELARLVRWVGKDSGFDLGYASPDRLSLGINGNAVTSKPTGYHSAEGSGDWMFFAAVFDGAAGQVTFYRGDTSGGGVDVVSVHPLSESETQLDDRRSIGVGNGEPKIRDRAFAGFLDNIRVFVSEGSSEGALGVEALDKIVAADLADAPKR
jgi:hypothetical protein